MASNLFPDELVFEILLRLRVKPLCRFRCVSSSWRAIIDDPVFRGAHRLHSHRNPPLLFTTNVYDAHACSLDKQGAIIDRIELPNLSNSQRPPHWRVVSTCLELVCLHDNFDNICIFNPTTRKSRTVPAFRTRTAALDYYRNRLCESYEIMFGFVSSTKQFKVILMSEWGAKCSVLTLGDDTEQWRYLPKPPPSIRPFRLSNNFTSAVVNGGMYMARTDGPSRNILHLDLEEEEWSLHPSIPMACKRNNMFNTKLYEVKGCLCTMKLDGNDVVHVWTLKDYRWVKEYKIDMHARTDYLPVDIDEDGRLLMSTVNDRRRLECYDAEGMLKGETPVPFTSFTTSRYVESFPSLENLGNWLT